MTHASRIRNQGAKPTHVSLEDIKEASPEPYGAAALRDPDLRTAFELAFKSGGLHPREKKVLRMMYGLNEQHETYTQEQVAEEMHVTPEVVRRIESRSIKKLKDFSTRPGFEELRNLWES
jgi:RNA polymerase sigma factor (sigma-70 family)